MRVKRYVADSIQEAISRVKNDLGRNAIILHTKPFKEGGFLGLFARRRFEVIAAVDENMATGSPKKLDEMPEPVKNTISTINRQPVIPEINQPATPTNSPVLNTQVTSPNFASANNIPNNSTIFNQVSTTSPVLPQQPVVQQPVVQPTISQPTVIQSNTAAFTPAIPGLKEVSSTNEPVLRSLREEIAEMKELIKQVATKPVVTSANNEISNEQPMALQWLQHYLLSLGMENEIAEYLVSQVPSNLVDNPNTLEEELVFYCQQVLVNRLMFSEPIQLANAREQQVMALIGPTGVGKTTTIAKLAANYNLFNNKKVGLITIDTYRIAAVEHLKTYGDIINLPVEVVYTPADLNTAFQNLHECDLILIDTAGRSPHNQVMMDELKKFLNHSRISLILLVISATTKYQDMLSIAENFSRIAYTHIVFTKLDETSSLGPIVSLAWKIRRPISYLTIGQNVPDDIEVARPEKLVEHLFQRSTYSRASSE